MADTSSVHKMIDKTIAVANTAEQKFSARTPCARWGVHNHSTADVLYVKTSDDNNLTNAIPIAAGAYLEIGKAIPQNPNPYDLSNYRFASPLTGAHRFTVEYFIA